MKTSQIIRERGSALIVSLVILTAVTLGAMVAMQRSSTQIRMITNLQHQQELENAALGTLNYLFDQMETNGALQTQILTKASSLYKDELAAGHTVIPQYDPFKEFNTLLTQPSFGTRILATDSISTLAQIIPSPTGSNFYLKSVPGCGTSCSALYASLTTTVQSKNNNLAVTQEIGVRRIAPGGIN